MDGIGGAFLSRFLGNRYLLGCIFRLDDLGIVTFLIGLRFKLSLLVDAVIGVKCLSHGLSLLRPRDLRQVRVLCRYVLPHRVLWIDIGAPVTAFSAVLSF